MYAVEPRLTWCDGVRVMDKWCVGLYKVSRYRKEQESLTVEQLDAVPWEEAEKLVPGFGPSRVFDLDTPEGPAELAGWLIAARFVLKSQNHAQEYTYYTVRGCHRKEIVYRLPHV